MKEKGEITLEEKKLIKISLIKFLLILAIIVIIVMGYYIYKLNIDKENAEVKMEEQNNKIGELENNISNLQSVIDNISNTIQTSDSNKTTKENHKQVILNGTYSEGATDQVYVFTSDGNAKIGSSLEEMEGTYSTIGENEIEITLVKDTILNMDTGDETIKTINETYRIIYVNENTLEVINKDGTSFKILKIE